MKLAERAESAIDALGTGAAATKSAVVKATRNYWVVAICRLIGFVLVMGLIVLVLLGWNWLQNLEDAHGRLWGEVLFFGFVIWLALLVLSVIVAVITRRIPVLKRLELTPITWYEALAWTMIVLIGVPLAVLYRWESVFILGGVTLVCVIALAFGWASRARPPLPVWVSIAAGALVLVGYAWLADDRTSEEITLAEPTAVVPGGADLAREFRPLLFFDSSERLPPVDIDDAVIHGCLYGLGAKECNNPLERDAVLDEFDYIKLTGTELGEREEFGGPQDAYYHHVVKKGEKVYVDYWWYFAHNPAPVARSLLCGQALRWLSEACAEHPADWEGMTLVLVPCRAERPGPECVTAGDGSFRIEEVRYAQHEKVVAYPWAMLRKRWRGKGYAEWFRGAGQRPLVFVALSSHASYAAPCGRCDQIVHPSFKERRNGRRHWANNRDAECRTECLKPLPVDEKGAPNAWNAFKGPWGAQHCILFGSYCDVRRAPRAPSFQRRYRRLDCVVPKSCLRPGRL